MTNSKYTLWNFNEIALEFNTDDELLTYLNDNGLKYEVCNTSRGDYVSIAESRYFITPGLLYFLQGEPHD